MMPPCRGRKSRIDDLPDGSVRKTYNQNDDPAGRFRREVGFYRHCSGSPLIPTLLGTSQDAYIVIERVTGDLMRDVDLTTLDLDLLTDWYVDAIVRLFDVPAPGADLKDRYVAFGFGSVVVDSMKKRGKPWGFSRLRTAFERHYSARIRSIGLT